MQASRDLYEIVNSESEPKPKHTHTEIRPPSHRRTSDNHCCERGRSGQKTHQRSLSLSFSRPSSLHRYLSLIALSCDHLGDIHTEKEQASGPPVAVQADTDIQSLGKVYTPLNFLSPHFVALQSGTEIDPIDLFVVVNELHKKYSN